MNEMNVTHEKLSKNVLRRLGTFVLALCMALSLLPSVLPPADAAFSDAAMDKLLNWGVVSGYPDGALHPDWPLTRAEFVAMVNRAYGYNELGTTPFIDVPDNAWFRNDINIGYNAHYFSGVSPRMAGPDQKLTREQAMVLLARNMRMQPTEGEVTEFTDGRDFSDWSRGYARAAQQAGVIGGYGDGSYKPRNDITRGEMAVMLQRALGTLINKPGTHTLADVYGNVTISSPNVLLKDSTIAGDLYITGGLSLGDVTLQNVRVLGNIIIAGGGESESGESVILRNVQADSLIVDSIAGQYLSLASEGDTLINEAILRTSAYVQDRTRPGEGLIQITLESLEAAAKFTLSGNLETVINKTPNSALKIAMGTVASLRVDEKALSSTLDLDINSTVEELNLDTATTVTGVGDIGDLFVNAPGADVEMLPDSVTIRPGLTADVAGQTMNALQAQESSADPRLQAGYPKVKNVAPTNANSVYSANKGGTVYWAVSNTVDGSIGEEDLIEPTAENVRITLSGTTEIENSNTEYDAALTPLTPDTNYYLSTIMTDARGRRSPVKVISFATPDNTVPAFAQGYPTVMKNYSVSITDSNGVVQRDEDGFPKRNYRVQVAAMPNKTCVLYYAVYPAGSTAPTAQQFRTGALGSPIRSGMEDASKNRINFIELTGLEQLTNYDIYLCYIDADGARSSPVQKLTFRTVDGKPPRFQYDTPVLTQELLTGLRLNVNVDENATIYWVATRDANYVKDGDWSDVEWWERACRQIESGTNSIRSGSVAARANADTVINITGLQAATRYYIFFVAKDAAGNYSEFFRPGNAGDDPDIEPPQQYTPHNQQPYKYYMIASTLDNIPPTATQEFTHYDAADPTRPYADTDIMIHFSEAVMQYSTHSTAAQEDFQDFLTLYNNHVKARKAYDDAVAAGVTGAELADLYSAWSNSGFVNALRATIKLYNNAAIGSNSVEERNATNESSIGDDWVIDYRYATVDYDAETGVMTVIFPANLDEPGKSALNLASGATYHFVLDDICDTSSSKNRMGRTQLPDFTTISAQVQLRTINVTRVKYHNEHAKDGPADENIPIDMAFSLTPISTSVEDNVDWDLLFWSDTSCEFEVYEITTNTNGADAVAIRPLTSDGKFSAGNEGHYSVPLPVENIEAPDADTSADNYLGYVGRSYFNRFYGVSGTFPSVTGKGNVLVDYDVNPDINPRGIMQRNVSKYYGIHFTSVDNEPEGTGRDSIWDATINFRISVVTASSSSNLDNLSRNLTNETITTFDGDTAGQGGSLIHTPRPFTLRKIFANMDAPNFDPQYPNFNALDTVVEMTLMLDRPGTVYYIIAPASTWTTSTNGTATKTYAPTITTYAFDGTPNGYRLQTPETDSTQVDTYERYWAEIDGEKVFVPRDGTERIVPAYNPNTTPPSFDHTTGAKTSKFELVSPANSIVYGNRDFGARTKSGSVQLGTESQIFPVEGLEPETVYLAYFVMQGTGQIYSERTQLFQFETGKIRRPQLSVQNNTSYADITSDMDATVDTGLFFMSSLSGSTLLSTPLDRVIDSRERDDWERYKLSHNNTTDKDHEDDLVWEAIITPYETGGSVFDRFADETTKDAVASLIRTYTQAGIRIDGSLNVPLTKDGPPESFRYDLVKNRDYILLAVARGTNNATGHSLGFGGARPLYLMDWDPPIITSIGGRLNVSYDPAVAGNASGGYVMDGYITLNFDHPLYLYARATGSTSEDNNPLLGTMLKSDFLEDGLDYFTPRDDDKAVGPVESVTIDYNAMTTAGRAVDSSQYMTVTRWLTSQYSGVRDERPLTIRITYDLATDTFTAIVGYAEVWFPIYNVNISRGTLTRPEAEGFDLDRYSLPLSPGGVGTITATMYPAGAQGTLSFAWEGTAVGSFVKLSDNTIQVTADESVPDAPKTGTIVVTLRVGTRTVQTTRVTVTVTPSIVARVVATPNEIRIPVSGGMAPTVRLEVQVDPGKTLPAGYRAIAGTSTGGGTNLSVTMVPADSTNTIFTVYISTTETTTRGTYVISFPAAYPALVSPGNLTVIVN